ncbi:MAG: glutamyl-tRNA reductase [Pseudohongiellaceae bacterium]|nr:MAG: glutamyl-tRNA reductase [Gammaproteobacteria bacterium RIFCSPLOWO2_02_FULL_57_10]
MALVLLGINHNTANVDFREQVAFPPEKVADAIRRATALDGVEELVIVSTCNRTELYAQINLGDSSAVDPDIELSPETLHEQERRLISWLGQYHGLDEQELLRCSYFHWRDDVLRHLMRVACGLDSMILGEPQILGQIKSAYAVSKEMGAIGGNLGRAFQEAFSIAKQVRTDTAIGENPVSVAYAAVSLAEQIFSDLPSLNALLIGAGRTIELVARHLTDKGLRNIVIANRTLQNAVELGEKFGAAGVLLSDIPEQLIKADIVVSSTNSQLPLLGKGAVESAIKKRRHKPMLLVDLAVPRDIEPQVGEIADAYLYSIDDIRDVIEDSVKSRTEAAAQASSIIERGVQEYIRQVRSLNAVNTLRAFREKAEQIRDREVEKALRALEKGDPAPEILEALARALTNKLIHSPSVQMKKASADGRDDLLLLTRELYELDQSAESVIDKNTDESSRETPTP